MAGADGMSTSRNKRGGGTFNYEIRFNVEYGQSLRSIEEIRKQIASDAAFAKGGAEAVFRGGVAQELTELGKGWKTAFGRDLRTLMRKNSQEMRAHMKSLMRVDTGRMRNAVRGRTETYPESQLITVGWVDIWYKYFGFQEEGTRLNGSGMGPTLRGGHYNIRGIRPMRSLNRVYQRGYYRFNADMSKFARQVPAQIIKNAARRARS